MEFYLITFFVFMCTVVPHLGQKEEEFPVVSTKSGRIQGKILKLVNGKEVAAFLGIFFAEPPVGPLRFKAPVPRTPWNETYNATSFGPLCVQSKNRTHWDILTSENGTKTLHRLDLRDYPQGEDCLNLNIYAPIEALPERRKDSKPLSVMFFIHGGSYKTNGGRFYPGEWLASAGQVIVVTVNYRLGVLGFLSTADDSAKGNYGLLDQILALQWIRDNIEAFGGNATDVTIFGNSAGGACVGLHLISPLSRGLFSKAIAQSGSPIGEWAVQRKPRMYVERLAKKLNCSDVSSSEAMLECLRDISPELIIEKSEDAKTLEDSLMLQFAPTVDGEFLLDHPTTMLQREGTLYDESTGNQSVPVPIMVGVTRDELEVWMTKYIVCEFSVRACEKVRRACSTYIETIFKFFPHTFTDLWYNRVNNICGSPFEMEATSNCTEQDLVILAYQDKNPSSIPFTKDLLRKYLLHLVRKDYMSAIAADVLLHAVYTEYVYRQGTTSSHHKKRRQQQQMTNGTAPYVENPSSALPDIRTLGKIISDIDLKAPSVKLVQLLSLHPNVTVYMYEFDYSSKDDVIVTKYGSSKDLWVGSYHESELYYIFGFPHMNLQNALRLKEDKQVADIMIQLWTDFAKTGNPTPRKPGENSAAENFTWQQYAEEEDCFATLGLQPFVARSYEAERMIFWNHFVPLFTEYPITMTSNKTKGFFGGHLECITKDKFFLFLLLLLVICICWMEVMCLCLCKSIKGSMGEFPIPV